jgi:hypothetical protein
VLQRILVEHRLAELRSIALHEAIGRELARKPELVEIAKRRVAEGAFHPYYRVEWQKVLALPLDGLVAFLTEDTERARALRQCTPFAGVIGPRERWEIWRRAREVA